jgi:hypothetical protein
MSDRHSWCSEFIYCPTCFQAVYDLALEMEDELGRRTFIVHAIRDRIVAGYISDTGGEASLALLVDWLSTIKGRLCHEVNFVVMLESEAMARIAASREGALLECVMRRESRE